jgi:uncharacterized membrane protein YkvA (DUF1232 family)
MMKVTFELSDKDLRYFRDCLKRVREGGKATDEATVIGGATRLVKEVLQIEVPDFVRERIVKLEQLIQMLQDGEWRLEGDDRARVLNALTYFVDPDDLIPDKLPGIGYLDDAIMVELVVQELRHEIEAYEDFCRFRAEAHQTRALDTDKLEARRVALQSRMRRRRRRDRSSRASRRSGGGRSVLSLW